MQRTRLTRHQRSLLPPSQQEERIVSYTLCNNHARIPDLFHSTDDGATIVVGVTDRAILTRAVDPTTGAQKQKQQIGDKHHHKSSNHDILQQQQRVYLPDLAGTWLVATTKDHLIDALLVILSQYGNHHRVQASQASLQPILLNVWRHGPRRDMGWTPDDLVRIVESATNCCCAFHGFEFGRDHAIRLATLPSSNSNNNMTRNWYWNTSFSIPNRRVFWQHLLQQRTRWGHLFVEDDDNNNNLLHEFLPALAACPVQLFDSWSMVVHLQPTTTVASSRMQASRWLFQCRHSIERLRLCFVVDDNDDDYHRESSLLPKQKKQIDDNDDPTRSSTAPPQGNTSSTLGAEDWATAVAQGQCPPRLDLSWHSDCGKIATNITAISSQRKLMRALASPQCTVQSMTVPTTTTTEDFFRCALRANTSLQELVWRRHDDHFCDDGHALWDDQLDQAIVEHPRLTRLVIAEGPPPADWLVGLLRRKRQLRVELGGSVADMAWKRAVTSAVAWNRYHCGVADGILMTRCCFQWALVQNHRRGRVARTALLLQYYHTAVLVANDNTASVSSTRTSKSQPATTQSLPPRRQPKKNKMQSWLAKHASLFSALAMTTKTMTPPSANHDDIHEPTNHRQSLRANILAR